MPRFEVEWAASGTAWVEADDADEAAELVRDSVAAFDAGFLDQFDVHDVVIEEVEECSTRGGSR